jgi:anti-sigma factor RsiW
MNCSECLDLLAERLDGAAAAPRAELERHLAECAACRQRAAAARRLGEGLRLLAPPAPPAGLTERVVAGVLAERRRRTRLARWARAAVAVAAGVLVIVLVSENRPRPTPPPPDVVTPAESISLRSSVAEAGSAVVSLTRRTADETVGQGRLLVPVVAQAPPEEFVPLPPMDPPAGPLREAGQGLSAGLEPVTSSARRAFDLFLREVPPTDPETKQGS